MNTDTLITNAKINTNTQTNNDTQNDSNINLSKTSKVSETNSENDITNLNTIQYKPIDPNTVYTGYFAKIKDYQQAGFTKFINITAYPPKYIPYKLIPCQNYSLNLSPDHSILLNFKKNNNINLFIQEYGKILATIDPFQAFELLKGSILLCYEKTGDFCHRSLIAMWLNSYNLSAEEYII